MRPSHRNPAGALRRRRLELDTCAVTGFNSRVYGAASRGGHAPARAFQRRSRTRRSLQAALSSAHTDCFVRLAADEPEVARAQAREGMKRWSQTDFQIQHYWGSLPDHAFVYRATVRGPGRDQRAVGADGKHYSCSGFSSASSRRSSPAGGAPSAMQARRHHRSGNRCSKQPSATPGRCRNRTCSGGRLSGALARRGRRLARTIGILQSARFANAESGLGARRHVALRQGRTTEARSAARR